MHDPERGAWLRRHRQQRGWSQLEMARRLIRAARDSDDEDPAPGTASIKRRINDWEQGSGISLRYRRLYCLAFGLALWQFGPWTDDTPSEPTPSMLPAVVDPLLSAAATMTYRGRQEPGLGEFAVRQEVAMAGHESSGHAAEREPYDIGEITFEQLRTDVVRLSRQTDTGAPLPVFRDLRRVRDQIHLLLDRRLMVRETADLYFLLGCINALMGIAANRLGYPGTAEQMLRAGWTYASIIDHNPLRAMLRARLAYVMYWQGRYSESRDLAADGLRYVSQGSPGAELHVFHARAAARVGDVDTARESVNLADAALDSDYNDDVMKIGGEFAITRATHQFFAGQGLVNVSGAEHDAAAKLEQAISMYDEGPGRGQDFWFGAKAMAGLDLSIVRLRSGALDAAMAALEPALTLPAEQRIGSITDRLADVRRELAAPIFQGSPQARALGEQIEAFSSDTVTADLHSLTG